jgi:hypothetical protein
MGALMKEHLVLRQCGFLELCWMLHCQSGKSHRIFNCVDCNRWDHPEYENWEHNKKWANLPSADRALIYVMLFVFISVFTYCGYINKLEPKSKPDEE